MNLRIDDRFIAIIANKEEERAIKSYFTWNDMKNAYAGGSFDIRKIKKVCFAQKKKEYLILRSGFLQELLELAKREGYKLKEVIDKRTKFPHQKKKYTDEYLAKYFPYNYNEHQVSALKRLLKINCGIVKANTGAGKGDVLIAFLKETKLPALIIVNKVALCDQLAERAQEKGMEQVGVWHGKIKRHGRVQFGTIQSIKSIPSLATYKICIFDEVHHCSSKTFQEFLAKTSYPIRMGFSATPDKGDEYSFALIRQHLGKIISETSAKELIENKVIALPKITFVKTECPPTLDWPTAYKDGIINNHERNMKITDLVERHNEPTLILIKDVKYKQGELLKKVIEENTHKEVEYIHGSTKLDRLKVIKDFESGIIDVLIATNILNEGISIRTIRVLINASGGKSKVENLQKLGRGTRIMDGKEEVKIYDFLDTGNKYTERHSILREKVYIKEGFTEIVHE